METPTPLTRRAALAMAAAALAAPAAAQVPPLSPADQALVDKAAAYLQGLTEAKARFTQTDGRGATATGVVYLKRPGKARFAYDPPSSLLVVSDGAKVSVLNPRLKTFDAIPLFTTPLSLFLGKTIRFDKGVQVTSVQRLADGFTITVRDGGRRSAGQISLTFTDNPMALAGWVAVDAQGRATRVRLSGLERAAGLDPSLFELKDPRPKNVGRGKL